MAAHTLRSRDTARRRLGWLLLMAGATTQADYRRRRRAERSTMCRMPRRMEAR